MIKRTAALLAATLTLTLGAGVALAAGRHPDFEPGGRGIGDTYFPRDGNSGNDVRRYALDLTYQPRTDRLSGTATISARATQDLSRFNLDLVGMAVQKITVKGKPASWSRAGDELQYGHRMGCATVTGSPSSSGTPRPAASRGLPRDLRLPGHRRRDGRGRPAARRGELGHVTGDHEVTASRSTPSVLALPPRASTMRCAPLPRRAGPGRGTARGCSRRNGRSVHQHRRHGLSIRVTSRSTHRGLRSNVVSVRCATFPCVATRRHWVIVASRDHARRGVGGGFVMANHGRRSPLTRMSPGDSVLIYSPTTSHPRGEPLRAVTIVGEVTGEEPEPSDVIPDGFRRAATLREIEPLPLEQIRDHLPVSRMRFGFFELDPVDAEVIWSLVEHQSR